MIISKQILTKWNKTMASNRKYTETRTNTLTIKTQNTPVLCSTDD